MHGRLNFLVIVIFVAVTLYCLGTHPFTQVAPMKARFVQQVHLGERSNLLLTERSPTRTGSRPGLASQGGYVGHHFNLRPCGIRAEGCFRASILSRSRSPMREEPDRVDELHVVCQRRMVPLPRQKHFIRVGYW